MKIVQSCSYAVESTENFQCIRLVDSQEQRRQFESWHLDLQLRPYHNFAFDAKQVNPIFGVPSTPEFVVSLLDKVQKKEGSISLPAVHPQILKRAGFELEERCIHESRETIIENESVENIKHYIWFGLLSGPPVIPLKDEHVKRFSRTLPRIRMGYFFQLYNNPSATSILRHMFNRCSKLMPDFNFISLIALIQLQL